MMESLPIDTIETSDASYLAFESFLIIIFIVGIIGNALVFIFVFVTKDYKKSITSWYVLHLATADTLFLITAVIRVVNSHSEYEFWRGTVASCQAQQSILFINYYASVLFLMVMSIDRYIAVCHSYSPDTVRKFRNLRVATIVTLTVWIVSILLTIPVMIYTDKQGAEPECYCRILFPSARETRKTFCESNFEHLPGFENFYPECPSKYCLSEDELNNVMTKRNEFLSLFASTTKQPTTTITTAAVMVGNVTYADNEENESGSGIGGPPVTGGGGNQGIPPECQSITLGHEGRTHIWINFTVMFLLPVLVMSICYGFIVRKFQHSGMANQKQEKNVKISTHCSGSNGDRRRVTLMCVTLVVVFIICWLLYHIVEIARQYDYVDLTPDGCRMLTYASVIMIYINSALNPYLYNFLGTGISRKWRSVKSSPFGKRIITLATGSTSHHQTRGSNGTGFQAKADCIPLNSAKKMSLVSETKQTNLESKDE